MANTNPSNRKIRKLLVANRGEIARRIFCTCRKLGISTVAVHSQADSLAPFVKDADESALLGSSSEASQSYLRGDLIIQIAKRLNVDAIHPGYGFLSENAQFSADCKANGIIFIGPSESSIRSMGSKIEAKNLLNGNDRSIPLIPGYNGDDQLENRLIKEALAVGFPLLIKASAGGGGKGMRIVRKESELKDAIDSARTEAKNSFGDEKLLIERYFDRVRHIEIQIFGDESGKVIALGERECSVQRRHQKVVEESPCSVITPSLRSKMAEAAVKIGSIINYVNAGTVEFIVDEPMDGTPPSRFYFLEVNTRLQVEHPVTEMVTGLDLVEIQLKVACGHSLSSLGLNGEPFNPKGHAIEVRLYAEDPKKDFRPSTGKVAVWLPDRSEGLRYDSGIEAGSQVSIYYDPMLCKIIAHGANRQIAVQRLIEGLKKTIVFGVSTNREYLINILSHPAFASAKLTTHFIQDYASELFKFDERIDLHVYTAVLLWDYQNRDRDRKFLRQIPSGFRNSPYRPQRSSYHPEGQPTSEAISLEYSTRQAEKSIHFQLKFIQKEEKIGENEAVLFENEDKNNLALLDCGLGGIRRRFIVMEEKESNRFFVHSDVFGTFVLVKCPRLPEKIVEESLGSDYNSPMPGKVIKMSCKNGEQVKKGQVLLVMESMKMETKVQSLKDGKVSYFVQEGQVVEAGSALLSVE